MNVSRFDMSYMYVELLESLMPKVGLLHFERTTEYSLQGCRGKGVQG